MTTERDIRNQIAYARQEGRAEGETSKAEQVALAMREAGEPAEKIALYTGLSIEQIQDFTNAAVKK